MPEFESVTLRDPSSSLSATYVPVAGMICTSLADDGIEFLGQRRGLNAYVANGKTMGIPILYPWANRLSASKYGINGAVVSLTVGTGGVRADEHGLPSTACWRPTRLAGHRMSDNTLTPSWTTAASRVCWRRSRSRTC